MKGLARLNRDVPRFRPFFSDLPSILPLDLDSFAVSVLTRELGRLELGPFDPNLCTAPTGELFAGVEVPDRVPETALEIASMVRETGPGVGAVGAMLDGGLPTCGGLTFSETMLGVKIFFEHVRRWVLSARAGSKKFGDTYVEAEKDDDLDRSALYQYSRGLPHLFVGHDLASRSRKSRCHETFKLPFHLISALPIRKPHRRLYPESAMWHLEIGSHVSHHYRPSTDVILGDLREPDLSINTNTA